jgi:hypothetical protein
MPPQIEYPQLASLDDFIGYLTAKLGSSPSYDAALSRSAVSHIKPTFRTGAGGTSTMEVH